MVGGYFRIDGAPSCISLVYFCTFFGGQNRVRSSHVKWFRCEILILSFKNFNNDRFLANLPFNLIFGYLSSLLRGNRALRHRR